MNKATLLAAIVALLAVATTATHPAEAGGYHNKVSHKTFVRDQTRQDALINENTEALVAGGSRVRTLENGQNRLFEEAEKSRQRDAAILALDKPMLNGDDNFGLELGLADAGAIGFGLSGVARTNRFDNGMTAYGSLGVGHSSTGVDSTEVIRAGIGFSW